MSHIQLKDHGGDTFMLQEVGDLRVPTSFPAQVLRDLPGLKTREDDIIIAAWMRSGTHWVWEMISMLLNNNAETIPKKKEATMFEYTPIKDLDALPSRRVFNTHLHFRNLPEDLKRKRCQVIYLLRDPRDTVASLFKLQLAHAHYDYTGKWENWLLLQLEGKLDWGTWFDHVRDWERVFEMQPNLDPYFWYYEEMKRDPVGELRKLSKFLGIEAEEALLTAIVDKCHLDRMREDKYKYEWLEKGVAVHYRTGKVGSWKEVFTVEQYEMFEKMYRDKMAGSKFEDRYKGPVEVV